MCVFSVVGVIVVDRNGIGSVKPRSGGREGRREEEAPTLDLEKKSSLSCCLLFVIVAASRSEL